MPMIHTQDAKLNVMQLGYKGTGEPEELVMVHGLAANMAFWLQHYAQHFSQRFRVTLYDLRGHGRSQLANAGYSPKHMGDDLLTVMDALNIEKAHVVAHSFGGVATLTAACKVPERFLSLVLNDTHISQGRERAKTAEWQSRSAIEDALASCDIELDTRDAFFGYNLLTEVARRRAQGHDVPEAILPWVKWVLSEKNQKVAARWLQLMDSTNAAEELRADDQLEAQSLSRITCPILGMYGEKSQAIHSGVYLSETLPHMQLNRIENAGHFFAKSQPERVIAACEALWDGLADSEGAAACM